MAITTKFGYFNITTAAAGNTQDISDVGFAPNFVIFWWNDRTYTSDAVGAGSFNQGIGFAVSTSDRRMGCAYSTDAAAKSETSGGQRVDECIGIINAAGNAFTALADYNGTISGGFQLIIDLQFSTSITVFYLAVGGLTNAATGMFQVSTTGSQDITSPGFQPTGGMLFSVGINAGINFQSAHSSLTIGGMSASDQQGFVCGAGRDNQNTMDTYGSVNTNSLAETFAAGAASIGNRITFAAWLSNGFTVTMDEATQSVYYHYLVWAGGNFSVKGGYTQTSTITSINIDHGFPPSAGMVLAAPWITAGAPDAADTPHSDYQLSIGGFTGSASRGCVSARDQDAQADANVAYAIEFDEVYIRIDESTDTLLALMDVSAISACTVTYIMDDADSVQNYFLSLVWGASTVAAATSYAISRKSKTYIRR